STRPTRAARVVARGVELPRPCRSRNIVVPCLNRQWDVALDCTITNHESNMVLTGKNGCASCPRRRGADDRMLPSRKPGRRLSIVGASAVLALALAGVTLLPVPGGRHADRAPPLRRAIRPVVPQPVPQLLKPMTEA